MSNILGIDHYRVHLRCATKARPRVTRNGTFMPKVYVTWKTQFAMLLKAEYAPVMRTEPLSMTINVYFKGKARGDADNYAGAVMDACQGVLYPNDKQVKLLHIELHEDHGSNRVELTVDIHKLEGEDGS